MTRRTWPIFIFGLAALLLATFPAAAAPLQQDEVIKLPCGHSVKVLSVSKIEYSKGVMALMLRYQTTLSVDNHPALNQEVDDVWKIAVKDVERYGFHAAIISTNEVPKGIFITANRAMNFIYEKGADGKWTRLSRTDILATE